MPNVEIEGTGSVDAAKYHLYVQEAAEAPADYKKATIDLILAAASHFKKIDVDFSMSQTKGDEVKIITGTDIVIGQNNEGSAKAYGLTSVDYTALMAAYQSKDVDIYLLKAPTAQPSGTCTVGQELLSSLSVNLYQALEAIAGQPIALNMSWTRTDEASETGILWNTIAVDA